MTEYDRFADANERRAFSPVCCRCVHHTGVRRCDAFDRIPDEIWLGKNPHTDAYPGDHGIRFERRQPK